MYFWIKFEWKQKNNFSRVHAPDPRHGLTYNLQWRLKCARSGDFVLSWDNDMDFFPLPGLKSQHCPEMKIKLADHSLAKYIYEKLHGEVCRLLWEESYPPATAELPSCSALNCKCMREPSQEDNSWAECRQNLKPQNQEMHNLSLH